MVLLTKVSIRASDRWTLVIVILGNYELPTNPWVLHNILNWGWKDVWVFSNLIVWLVSIYCTLFTIILIAWYAFEVAKGLVYLIVAERTEDLFWFDIHRLISELHVVFLVAENVRQIFSSEGVGVNWRVSNAHLVNIWRSIHISTSCTRVLGESLG